MLRFGAPCANGHAALRGQPLGDSQRQHNFDLKPREGGRVGKAGTRSLSFAGAGKTVPRTGGTRRWLFSNVEVGYDVNRVDTGIGIKPMQSDCTETAPCLGR